MISTLCLGIGMIAKKERPRIMILYVSTCLANMKVPSLYLSSMQMRFLMVNGGIYSVNTKIRKTLNSCLNKENLHLRDLQKVMEVTSTKILCVAKN